MIDRDTLMEAGEAAFGPGFLYHGMWTFNDAQLTRFAQAVAQKAVEACAKVAEGMHEEDRPSDYAWAIRNRGIGGGA